MVGKQIDGWSEMTKVAVQLRPKQDTYYKSRHNSSRLEPHPRIIQPGKSCAGRTPHSVHAMFAPKRRAVPQAAYMTQPNDQFPPDSARTGRSSCFKWLQSVETVVVRSVIRLPDTA